jgi:hypothetical protein
VRLAVTALALEALAELVVDVLPHERIGEAPRVPADPLGSRAAATRAGLLVQAPAAELRDLLAVLADLGSVEQAGQIRQTPIPGKLKLLRSTEWTSNAQTIPWVEMPVDYRAVARRAILATSGVDVWVATDTGMILRWQR